MHIKTATAIARSCHFTQFQIAGDHCDLPKFLHRVHFALRDSIFLCRSESFSNSSEVISRRFLTIQNRVKNDVEISKKSSYHFEFVQNDFLSSRIRRSRVLPLSNMI